MPTMVDGAVSAVGGAMESGREERKVRDECLDISPSVQVRETRSTRGGTRARAWLPRPGRVLSVEAFYRARVGQ